MSNTLRGDSFTGRTVITCSMWNRWSVKTSLKVENLFFEYFIIKAEPDEKVYLTSTFQIGSSISIYFQHLLQLSTRLEAKLHTSSFKFLKNINHWLACYASSFSKDKMVLIFSLVLPLKVPGRFYLIFCHSSLHTYICLWLTSKLSL